jgi:hypothetical protein
MMEWDLRQSPATQVLKCPAPIFGSFCNSELTNFVLSQDAIRPALFCHQFSPSFAVPLLTVLLPEQIKKHSSSERSNEVAAEYLQMQTN